MGRRHNGERGEPAGTAALDELAASPAARAFVATLRELGTARDAFASPELGRRAALLVGAGIYWEQHVGPFYTTDQVMTLLGVTTRQAVSDLVQRCRLLALPAGNGRVRYPAFQFGPNGKPLTVMPDVLKLFADVDADPYTAASWWQTPQPLLDGQTPSEWLRSGGAEARVVEAARRTVAGLAQ